MENWFEKVKLWVLAVAGAFFTAFGYDGVLIALWIFCMVLDYLTGSIGAALRSEWNSTKAREGIMHKMGMLGGVLLCALCDALLGTATGSMQLLLTRLILIMFMVTELGSIFENLGKQGVKLPAWLKTVITKLQAAAEQQGNKAVGTLTGDEQAAQEALTEKRTNEEADTDRG